VARSISSKKRVRQNVTRRAINRWRRDQVKQAVKGFEEALAGGDKAKAAEQLKTVYHVVDKVAAKGTMHKNTASRKKSRLAVRLAKLA
jgi:small subunit ribosomal protein S20